MRRECSSLTDLFSTLEISDPLCEEHNLRFATVRSQALGRRVDASVWAPEATEINTLIILLHGVYGSHWVWTHKGGVHLTAQRLYATGVTQPMAIIMPSDGLRGDGSGYLRHHDDDAESWIVHEVPALAQLMLPALRTNPKLAIAGLSMGGYGALRLGAKYGERFSSISAHSAITDIDQMADFISDPVDLYSRSQPREELSTLYWILKNREYLPRMRFDCGIHDPLIAPNRILHDALQRERIDHVYEEFSGGHEWSYWQGHVQETLKFVSAG